MSSDPSGGPISFTLEEPDLGLAADPVEPPPSTASTFRVSPRCRTPAPAPWCSRSRPAPQSTTPTASRPPCRCLCRWARPGPSCAVPDDPIDVAQAESVRIDIGAVCHVWTAVPRGPAGSPIRRPSTTGPPIGLSAPLSTASSGRPPPRGPSRPRGHAPGRGGRSKPGEIRIRVVRTPPPSLAPDPGLRRSRPARPSRSTSPRYLTPGVSDPVPTVVEAQQLTNLGVPDLLVRLLGDHPGRRQGARPRGLPGGDERRRGQLQRAAPEGRRPVSPWRSWGCPTAGRARSRARRARLKVSLDWRAPAVQRYPAELLRGARPVRGRARRCGATPATSPASVQRHDVPLLGARSQRRRLLGVERPPRSARCPTSRSTWWPDQARRGWRPYLHIRWKPVETKGGARSLYVIKWAGGRGTTSPNHSPTWSPNLDDDQSHQFTRPPSQRVHDRWRPDLARSSPSAPTTPAAADRHRPGDRRLLGSGVAHLAARRRQRSDAGALHRLPRRPSAPACSGNIHSQRDSTTPPRYDGHVYRSSVRATNAGGNTSAAGPPTPWRATGKPASWGGWSCRRPAANNQATREFTVPVPRSESSLRVYATASEVQPDVRPGLAPSDLSRCADNLTGPRGLSGGLQRGGACTQSSAQTVQTFGPTPEHIHAITPSINVHRDRLDHEVDSNGGPGRSR